MPEELSPAAATWLLRAGLRDARRGVRNGQPLSPLVREALRFIAPFADAELAAGETNGSATRTTPASLSSGEWVTVAEASDLVEVGERWIQHLARNDRVRHRRIGARTYEIELGSLRRVLERTKR